MVKHPVLKKSAEGAQIVRPRFGLCCTFLKEDISFKTRTAKYLSKFEKKKRFAMLAETLMHNLKSLGKAMSYCLSHGIGSFRITSRFFPLKTHPVLGYSLRDLPDHGHILSQLANLAVRKRECGLRFSLHPDQFTLLSSPDEQITSRSIEELFYHLELAEYLDIDVINIHGGGGYGNKREALERVEKNIKKLPSALKTKLTLENDDKIYSPSDLLPLCERVGIPFVYDVHHHRCKPDGQSVEKTTEHALSTWNREPLFHLSSPKNGWNSGDCKPHHDFINPDDFPSLWKNLPITIEIEAKAKEVAIRKLALSM